MYQLTVTEKQLRMINTALEEYFRVGLNQWGNLADRIASIGVDFSRDNPKHDKIFDDYISKRDDVRVVLEAAGRILWPYGLNKQADDNLVAQDIYQVIRHQLWLDNQNRDELSWIVDSQKPFLQSGEPPVLCVNIQDAPGGKKNGESR